MLDDLGSDMKRGVDITGVMRVKQMVRAGGVWPGLWSPSERTAFKNSACNGHDYLNT
jgi:hypothetical protein